VLYIQVLLEASIYIKVLFSRDDFCRNKTGSLRLTFLLFSFYLEESDGGSVFVRKQLHHGPITADSLGFIGDAARGMELM
jgi:hypothetical protein